MAFAVYVSGIPKDGETLFELNPVWWWGTNELMEDDRFTEKPDTSSYTDYVADLDLANMRALQEHFRPYATRGVYEDVLWQKDIQPVMQQLDEALYKQADRYQHFHVCCYEWESGI